MRKTNRFFVWALALVFAGTGLAVTTPAAAQELRGSIEGVVKDAQGGLVPNAQIEARNQSGGVVSTASDGTGSYRFPALSPGLYDVTASLKGFRSVQFPQVEVRLGQIKRLEFTLEPGGVAEKVEVSGFSPLINITQSARATNIRDEQVELLPKGRDFTTLVTQAPGANYEQRLGGISIDGSSASENRFIVDGIETTDIQTGVSGQQLLADFVEEVQVKSSGFPAEFGGATGGVINVITKSGTNQVRGSGLFYWEGTQLSAGRYTFSSGSTIGDFGGSTGAAPRSSGGRDSLRLNPVTNQLEYIRYPEDSWYRTEPGFSFGGPIVRDKAWFYAAYQPTLMRNERTVKLLAGPTVTEDQTDRRQFLTVNQTAQIGAKLRTRVAFNNSHRTRDGLLPQLDGTDLVGTPYNFTRKFPGWNLAGNADYVARSDVYFGVRAGYSFTDISDSNFPNEPRFWFDPLGNIGLVGTNGVAVPPAFQQGAQFSSIPTASAFVSDFDKQKRLSFQADATWYTDFGGRHTFKGGVQLDHLGNEVLSGESRNRVRIRWDRALSGRRGPFGYYQVRSNGVDPKRGFITEGNVSTTNVGLFFQDAWTINNRVTINAGIRTERERVPTYGLGPDIPRYGIAFDFQDKLAPRLGLAWDLRGDGRSKAYASWGVFYDIFKLELPRGSFGGDKWLEYYYTLDTPDWRSLVSGPNCPPACSGTLIQGPIDFRHPAVVFDPADPTAGAVDPDLKPMRLQEAAVGFEQQLANNLAASVRYVHKQVDRAIEDTGAVDAQQNEIYAIANPGEGLALFAVPGVPLPKAQRDYDAVEFALDRRYSNNWSLRVSYMWSRLFGNYSGLSQGDENGRTSPNVGRLFDLAEMMFDEKGRPVFGRLPTDRPHQVKTQAIYTLPMGTSIGAYFQIQTGVPVSRELGFLPPNNFPIQYRGRGSDGRTDVYSQTDLYVQHEFRVAGDRRVQVSLNVINLFDQSASIGKWSTYELDNGIRFDSADFFAGRLDFDQLIRQQGVTQDPRFLQDSWYQFPISARLGLKFLF